MNTLELKVYLCECGRDEDHENVVGEKEAQYERGRLVCAKSVD
jgi:hypothetical protein